MSASANHAWICRGHLSTKGRTSAADNLRFTYHIHSKPIRDMHKHAHAARFNAERRKDRAQISGLVQDASAVEVALRNGITRRRRRSDNDSCHGGGGSSAGGTVGSSTSTASNAYVEPSEPKEDPNFISLEQARRWLDTGVSIGFINSMLLSSVSCVF